MDLYSPPTDLLPLRTADGSFTLGSASLHEHYHSLHGAVAEGRHVYIRNGLLGMGRVKLDILEVGFGTGLNALLTWVEADEQGMRINYVGMEPWPIAEEVFSVMDHAAAIGSPGRGDGITRMMRNDGTAPIELSAGFRFQATRATVQCVEAVEAFDLVYFDAFAPVVQPEMWTVDVFRRLYRSMRPGARLVTYCSKTSARRAMEEGGLVVERLKGPRGKRHMVRAHRPE